MNIGLLVLLSLLYHDGKEFSAMRKVISHNVPWGPYFREEAVDEQGNHIETQFFPKAALRLHESFDDAGRIAVVTGGAPGGIGHATSAELALVCGYQVIHVDKNKDNGMATVESILAAGGAGSIRFVHADVADPSGVKRVMDEARELGGLHLLVNNAGHAGDPSRDNFFDFSGEEFGKLIDANLTSAFRMTQAAAKEFMIPQREGVIIMLGSTNGNLGVLGQTAYGAAKAALRALTRSAATQFGGYNIRTNLVVPGIVETNSPNWIKRRQHDQRRAEKEGRMNPLGRIGKPDDVAKLIAFLASPDADFLNGAEFVVDGGLLASGVLVPGLDPTKEFRDGYVQAVAQLDISQKKAA